MRLMRAIARQSRRAGMRPGPVALVLWIAASAVGAGSGREPKVFHLSPRRFEQRIDARGHDRLSLRATAAPPAFLVTVVFLDLTSGRRIGGAQISTDAKKPLEVPSPAPMFRIRLRGSTSRDFQLDLTLQ